MLHVEEEKETDDGPPKEKELPIARDMTETPPPITTGKRKRTAKRGKIGKKPADMPRRPLSGYNYFFSEQRSIILEEQSRVKDEKRDIFTTLGRIVADRWKKLNNKDKEKYNELAAKDLIRYRQEMEKYNDLKRAFTKYIFISLEPLHPSRLPDLHRRRQTRHRGRVERRGPPRPVQPERGRRPRRLLPRPHPHEPAGQPGRGPEDGGGEPVALRGEGRSQED